MKSPIILFGWYEYPDGTSSARGGANDLVLDKDGKVVSLPTAIDAKNYLNAAAPPGINVAQVFDLSTGVFEEFERKQWTPRQPKPPKQPPAPKSPPANPPNANAAGTP